MCFLLLTCVTRACLCFPLIHWFLPWGFLPPSPPAWGNGDLRRHFFAAPLSLSLLFSISLASPLPSIRRTSRSRLAVSFQYGISTLLPQRPSEPIPPPNPTKTNQPAPSPPEPKACARVSSVVIARATLTGRECDAAEPRPGRRIPEGSEGS